MLHANEEKKDNYELTTKFNKILIKYIGAKSAPTFQYTLRNSCCKVKVVKYVGTNFSFIIS